MKTLIFAALLITFCAPFAHTQQQTVTPAPDSKKLPADNIIIHPFRSIPAPITTLTVRITDAYVPFELLGPLADAMKDPIGKQRRLLLISHDAAKQGRRFVLVHGVRADCVLLGNGEGEIPDSNKFSPISTRQGTFLVPTRNSMPPPAGTPDKRVKYPLFQSLAVAGRLRSDGMILVNLALTEKFKNIPGSPPDTVTDNSHTVRMSPLSFFNGETKLITSTVGVYGDFHDVYATVNFYPPKQ